MLQIKRREINTQSGKVERRYSTTAGARYLIELLSYFLNFLRDGMLMDANWTGNERNVALFGTATRFRDFLKVLSLRWCINDIRKQAFVIFHNKSIN